METPFTGGPTIEGYFLASVFLGQAPAASTLSTPRWPHRTMVDRLNGSLGPLIFATPPDGTYFLTMLIVNDDGSFLAFHTLQIPQTFSQPPRLGNTNAEPAGRPCRLSC